MPDSPNPLDAPEPGLKPRNWSRAEIDAAIAGLDRATRRFTGQVDAIARGASATRAAVSAELQREAPPLDAPPRYEAPTTPSARTPLPPMPAERRPERREPPAPEAPTAPRLRQFGGLDREADSAEREALEYLAQAKKRADSLVATMIGAVEREAAELRKEAEEGIRSRWNAVEEEAGRYLEDARRVADGMVTERQDQISSLSDEIVTSARQVTSGLEDAARVRAQFEAFVRTLSATAGRIAEETSGAGGRGEPGIGSRRERPAGGAGDAMAA
jgi:vacuolar-type H+-ATPase subunit H